MTFLWIAIAVLVGLGVWFSYKVNMRRLRLDSFLKNTILPLPVSYFTINWERRLLFSKHVDSGSYTLVPSPKQVRTSARAYLKGLDKGTLRKQLFPTQAELVRYVFNTLGPSAAGI